MKAGFFGWKNDGSTFYVITNERDAKFFDLYKHDAKTYARTMIYQNNDGLNPAAISDDEKWIASNKPNTTNDSNIWLHNVEKKETKLITTHTGNVSFDVETFDPQSLKLFFVGTRVTNSAACAPMILLLAMCSITKKPTGISPTHTFRAMAAIASLG